MDKNRNETRIDSLPWVSYENFIIIIITIKIKTSTLICDFVHQGYVIVSLEVLVGYTIFDNLC